MEQWKDIPGYEGKYQASNLGEIKSLSRPIYAGNTLHYVQKEKTLKQVNGKNGYKTVALCREGNCKKYTVHQLVAMAFLGHSPNGFTLVINHKNFDKHDNSVKNLEIVTNRQNSNLKHVKSTSEYVGVNWSKQKNRWRSLIYFGQKQKHLGYFKCELAAAYAYHRAANGDSTLPI